MRRRSAHRPSALLGWLLVACMAVALPANLAAQNLDGSLIREISFEGLQLLTADTLLFYLALEEGAPYDSMELNRKIHELWARQLIDDVSVEAEAVDGGVRLIVRLRERPTLRSVEYVGLKRINKSDISDRTARDRIRVREGDPVNLGELYRLKSAIEDLYGEKGYRLAEARFAVEEVSVTDRKVLFTIDEGDKVRVEDIDFEGNTVYRDIRLRWHMKKTKESGLIMSMLKKDVYNPASLEEDLDSIRDVYRKAGYKNVVLGVPKIEVKATKPKATDADKQKRRLFVTIPVEEGDRWKLGEITVEGNETFGDEILLRQFKRPAGGWLKSSVIDEGVETLTELYSNTGHLFARIKPELIEREDQIADLVIHISEGDQFRIGRIEFEGNTKTKDKVIRREMGIQEGRILNQGALKNSLLRIGQMEFFKVDEQDPVQFDFNNEEKTVDLRIKGEEGDRTELLFGAGFSEIDGFFGQLQFKTRNFLGRGETLGVSLQSGSRQDVFDISYHVPWFLDRPQSIGFQAFKRRLRYDLLSGQSVFQDNQGGIVTYGRNLGLFKSLSISYSLFDQVDEREQFNLEGELVSQDFSRKVSSVRVGYNMDRRDSRLQPSFGMRYNLSAELAGGILGGTTNYVRPAGTFTKYLPVTKGRLNTVAAFNVSVGMIEPYGGIPLSFNDRYYLGGENSVRGFRFRSLWVRDEEGDTVTDEFGFPLGGERFYQFNLEYIFLVGGPFPVILFSDAGKVFLAEQGLNLDNLRATYGAELQVNVPILGAPLRFIYSNRFNELPDDRFESFQFSIGPSF